MSTATFPSVHIPVVRQALATLAGDAQQVRSTVHGRQPSGAPEPHAIIQWIRRAEELKKRLDNVTVGESISVGVSAKEIALVRTAVALSRRRLAEESERAAHLFHSTVVRTDLTKGYSDHDKLLNSALANVEPEPRPRLGDYLTVEGLELSAVLGARKDRERDPKHRILWSSSLLGPDIAILRRHCEERGVRLGVLFADLDSFKLVNSALGEVVVDRSVLPQVLSAVERAAFGQAEAYRFGGDEFVLLLPNTSETRAVWVAQELGRLVSALPMPPGVAPVTTSIGVWITGGESHLTDSELVQRASEAKSRAKELGRRRIVVWDEAGSGRTETVHPAEA